MKNEPDLQAARVLEEFRRRFPVLCIPRKKHQCRICGQQIEVKEPCCRWRGFDSDGPFTSHAHPECYRVTIAEKWREGDWETFSPGDMDRPPKDDTLTNKSDA